MLKKKTQPKKRSASQDSATNPLPDSDPRRKPFEPEVLDRTVISIPLLNELRKEQALLADHPERPPIAHAIVIDLNLEYRGGREKARQWVINATRSLVEKHGDTSKQVIDDVKSRLTPQYIFAKLHGNVIRELVKQDMQYHDGTSSPVKSGSSSHAIFHIWPDFKIRALISQSLSTVKADAARASFAAYGDAIVWAVMDSGIDGTHRHFALHRNLKLDPPLEHVDFTGGSNPLTDQYGHGTHVAGILAGEIKAAVEAPDTKRKVGKASKTKKPKPMYAVTRQRNEHGEVTYKRTPLDNISGMAPKCKLVSFKVLDANGEGDVSSLIAAIGKIQEINGYGRRLIIHGVNISIGNDFEPEWFACGQSPLCVEVNSLVRSGVVVVVAAGNSGYASVSTENMGILSAGMGLTVNDPGNAEKCITVGSTHRDMPHIYGVSYFSSKGPTGDGRAKPDLVAPGEKILSSAAGKARERAEQEVGECEYVEDSGTSMAAPHVSGVIAAFLSIRREYIGKPEEVKEIFLSTATDLKREKYFQGHGLVDLMRAIQSV